MTMKPTINRAETPNEIGAALEQHVAGVLGGRTVTQSGGGKWIKLDVSDRARIVVSCKASKQTSLRDTAMRSIFKLWREAVRGARGFQGHGEGARPAMVFEHEGTILMLAELDTWADLATGEIQPYVEPSKGEERRQRARRSLLD